MVCDMVNTVFKLLCWQVYRLGDEQGISLNRYC